MEKISVLNSKSFKKDSRMQTHAKASLGRMPTKKARLSGASTVRTDVGVVRAEGLELYVVVSGGVEVIMTGDSHKSEFTIEEGETVGELACVFDTSHMYAPAPTPMLHTHKGCGGCAARLLHASGS